MKLSEVKETTLTMKNYPNNEVVYENPPRFMWVPINDNSQSYNLEISKNEDFNSDTLIFKNIEVNFFTLDKTLDSGKYFWRVLVNDEGYTYSSKRTFEIAEDAVESPLISREKRYDNVNLSHPRIWLGGDKLSNFREKLKADKSYCGFDKFYENSVKKYIEADFVKEPQPYPNNIRVVKLWRRNYQDCQEALQYIRSLSVAGVILEDNELIEKAKKALLEISDWDLKGTTSRGYNDECAFRVAYALGFGYDYLYNYMIDEERNKVKTSLIARTDEVFEHVHTSSKIHFSLYDSHAVRSLSQVLVPCSIAFLGEDDRAKKYLDYTIDYLGVVYTPWGGVDGGWAEGPMYWTSGMAFVIDAINVLKNYFAIDLYKRPFFNKTGDFPLYCNPVDTYRASFSDQSNLGKLPGLKTATNIRQFAGVTKNKYYYDYYENIRKREPIPDNSFFNNGWWDFDFDDMVFEHDYQNVSYTEKTTIESVKHFRDIGWVAINENYDDFENHIFFLTKSSGYGCVSHSHGDQNSILLFAYGEPLIARSGYYVGFNTSMHKDWRRQTKSHNNILVNGIGQYAGFDKVKQLEAKGEVLEVLEKDNYIYIKEDATRAYFENIDYLENYTREIYFIDKSYFVIVDTVNTKEESNVDWLLHSIYPYQINENSLSFKVAGEKASLVGQFIHCKEILSITQSDEFEGVDLTEIENEEKQYHLKMKTGKEKNHKIVTLLVPSKNSDEKNVTIIKDDQGHDVYYYLNHEGSTFTIKIDGNSRY